MKLHAMRRHGQGQLLNSTNTIFQVRQQPHKPIEEWFKSFTGHFTDAEWCAIRAAAPDEAAMENAFRRNWSLKEVRLSGSGRTPCQADRASLRMSKLHRIQHRLLPIGCCPGLISGCTHLFLSIQPGFREGERRRRRI